MEHDRYSKTLSQNLRAIRKNKGLTTVDVARILGVSQAKISYIEHCKGVLSARDVAVLAKRLNVPVTDFFRDLSEDEETSGINGIVGHLVRFGATLLAKPAGVPLASQPFEEIIARSLGFLDDDRLQKGFCAALITHASRGEINTDRLFALIGNNPFLTAKVFEQAHVCLKVIDILIRKKQHINPRAKQQIQKVAAVSESLHASPKTRSITTSDVEPADIAEFVKDCLNAKS